MKEQFVTYEIALGLKELGFQHSCFGYFGANKVFILNPLSKNKNSLSYNDYPEDAKPISAPLWQQAIDWLREKHLEHIEIWTNSNGKYRVSFQKANHYYEAIERGLDFSFETFYEARESAILELIESCQKIKTKIYD